MVIDRKTGLAVLALVVVVLSRWPVLDSSSLQSGLYLCGAVLLAALAVSERARASRIVVGALGVLFVLQGGYEVLSRESVAGLVVGAVYVGLGALVVLYQSGVAPWGTPGGSVEDG